MKKDKAIIWQILTMFLIFGIHLFNKNWTLTFGLLYIHTVLFLGIVPRWIKLPKKISLKEKIIRSCGF